MISPLVETSITPSRALASPEIVAVAVLYQRSLAESESVSSLLRILETQPALVARFSLIVYDNSPEAQLLPQELPLQVDYVHNGANGGLAPAYNYALQHALAIGAPWLLLLDQDTTLTANYLTELFERMDALGSSFAIGAIVPKLTASGGVYSPESSFLYRMRMQLRKKKHSVELGAVGVQGRPMSAYNSGALVRTNALQQVGGFPADFWLDYLDHAVFEELERKGYRIFVMQAALEQKLSHLDINDVPHWRHRNVLTAQTRYIRRYGGWIERTMFRLYLLRNSHFLWRRCINRDVWKEMLLQALLLRIPSIRIGK